MDLYKRQKEKYHLMEKHFNLTDEAFESHLQNASLEKELFTHEAHLRLAWIHLSKYGEEIAIKNITGQLKKYVAHLGAADKYNETLTVAAIKMVHHFMSKEMIDNFQDFITKFPRLKYQFKDLISQHYGFDIFNSKRAKVSYLKPDLSDFNPS